MMQNLTLAMIGAASLFAVPAFAQSSSKNSTSSTGNSNTSASNQQMSSQDLQKSQQKITQDLKSDGYTNVKVVPDSFLVHATNKHNQPVVMIINPDSVFAVTQLSGKNANSANASGTSGQQSGLGSSTSSTPSKQ